MDGRVRIILCLLLLAPLGAAADERARAEAELEAVRERIGELQADMARQDKRRSRAERELREVERSEQTARRELQAIRDNAAAARRRQAGLQQQAAEQRASLQSQQQALAGQLRIAWMNGDAEWLRVMLSQQDAAALGRRMTYYSYFSRQRASAIEDVRDILEAIEQTGLEIQQEIRRLRTLESEAADKLEEIADTRAERAQLVARIGAEIAEQDAEIAALRSQEETLGELIRQLAARLPAMPDVDAEPFAGQTAQLEWPADGPLLKRFGQSRADGSLKWNGMLLGAPAGSDVRAVYHGRVVFSDWLSGMGLLTIVEHDGGYMTLYGHNQDLLKEVGEWVAPGEPIAHVGDSGGQANAGLYFEIRKDGRPVNPQNWLK